MEELGKPKIISTLLRAQLKLEISTFLKRIFNEVWLPCSEWHIFKMYNLKVFTYPYACTCETATTIKIVKISSPQVPWYVV